MVQRQGMEEMKIETDDFIVEFEVTQEVKDKVFEAVLGYYKDYQAFCGESIMQSDDPIIYAPDVFSKIADDILKFRVTCKE